MKSFALLLVAGVALAQDLNSLPDCGKTCISNMLAIAQSQFGCAQGDAVCYCTQPRFGYGVRDCSNEACPNAGDAAKVVQFGTQYCESIAASASQSGGAISTGALGILSSAAATATATGGSDQSTQTGTPTGGAAASSAASSAGSALSSATESANSALSSLSASASSVAASISSAASSVEASLSSQLASATNSAASRASSAAGSATGGAQSSGLAPKMTGVPVAGAIGIAAMLLI